MINGVISYEIRDQVAVITMGRPPVNSLGYSLRAGIAEAIDLANADEKIKAIVLTGSNRAFSGGADITEFNTPEATRDPRLTLLGALQTSEAIYISAIADEQGAPLLGSNNYRFRIPPEGIPAQAFWSMTLYEVDPFGGMYFTANPLKRYAVSERTQGLKKNEDGSIDIWITHAQPVDSNRLANWLPAPSGLFRLMIRAYAPSVQLQSGEVLPPIVKKWM